MGVSFLIPIIRFAELAVIRFRLYFDVLPNYKKFWRRINIIIFYDHNDCAGNQKKKGSKKGRFLLLAAPFCGKNGVFKGSVEKQLKDRHGFYFSEWCNAEEGRGGEKGKDEQMMLITLMLQVPFVLLYLIIFLMHQLVVYDLAPIFVQ